MKRILPFVLCLGLFFLRSELSAQIYPMENGEITLCSGSFSDDGGGSPYTLNSYTFTICPDTPGDVIMVTFDAFSLYSSPNANNSDYLQVFDGDTPAAQPLGSYTGTGMQGNFISGSIDNVSGCLTFVFEPNPNSPGAPGWEASITCTTPCANPVAAYEIVSPAPTGPSQSIGVCAGQDITFGDAGSYAQPGFNIEHYVWQWDDGTTDTVSTPQDITHAFDEPGEYIVNLQVLDNNGCRNMNLEPLQVLVSTIPIFNTEFNSPICLDEPVPLDGSAVLSPMWTALPPQVVAGTTYLPDGAGLAYTSELVFDFFETGAVLEDCNDLLSITANMEHSYMGDLGISIICPNGTTVYLMNYPNGGLGTYFGEAVDVESSTTPGTGYDYGWSPTSTNGYVYDDANHIDVSFIDNDGNPDDNSVVAPGIYQSDEDLCNLVGCPLNGEWTLSIEDFLGIDNGYIFEWGINFNPNLYPGVTTFTPIIGMGSDSTYWTGPNIVSSSADGNVIQIEQSIAGDYQYTFTAINNFGCAYDTTITVTAIEGPDITAGPDLQVCADPVMLQAGMANGPEPVCSQDAGDYSYCYQNSTPLVVTYCPDAPNSGTFMQIDILAGTVESGWDEFYVYDGDNVSAPLIAGPLYGDLSGMTFSASNPGGCITFRIDPDGSVSCGSGSQTALDLTVSCNNGGGNLIWSWSPATGLSNPNIQNPTAYVTQATTYTVSAYPPGMPGCIITDQVTVAPNPEVDPGIDNNFTLCFNSPAFSLTDSLGGNPAPNGTWVNLATGETVSPMFTPSDHPNGGFFNFQYTVGNGICENQSSVTFVVLPFTDNSCCQTNAHAGVDTVACGLSLQLNAQPTIGTGTWTGPSNVSFSDIHDPHATVTATSPGGAIWLKWTDDNGYLCSVADSLVVHFADPISMDVVPFDALCADSCNGSAVAVAMGGTVANDFSYYWSEGYTNGTAANQAGLCPGTQSVKIVDDLGCADSTTFIIGEPDPITTTVSTVSPSCYGDCDGKIVVTSAQAVEYSYDGGLNYSSENTGYACAGTHKVVVRNSKGCPDTTIVNLVDPEKYVANFNINPNPTTIKNTLITLQDISAPGPATASEWSIEAGNNVLDVLTKRNTSYQFPSDTSGSYIVRLTSTNNFGCVDSIKTRVVINDDLLWYVPNSFTPNEDGINDIWRPIGKTMDVDQYHVVVFDRWGNKVFETSNYKQGWNGSENNGDYYAPAGTYIYQITFTSSTTKEKHQINGSINLLR